MKKELFLSFLAYSLLPMAVQASEPTDTLASERNYTLNEVVVTGTRNATDIRHLPMTISVVGRTRYGIWCVNRSGRRIQPPGHVGKRTNVSAH